MGEPKVCFMAGGDPLSTSEMMDAREVHFRSDLERLGPSSLQNLSHCLGAARKEI